MCFSYGEMWKSAKEEKNANALPTLLFPPFMFSIFAFLSVWLSDLCLPSPLLSYFRNDIWIAFRDHACCLILIDHDSLCVCAGAAAFMSKVTVVPVRCFQMHLRFSSIFRIETNEIFPKVYLLPFFSPGTSPGYWFESEVQAGGASHQWLLYRRLESLQTDAWSMLNCRSLLHCSTP